MSRTQDRASTKSPYRRGESKQYGVKARRNWRAKSNAKKKMPNE